MTDTQQKSAAKAFSEYWKDKGNEKQETARFWIELLGNVLGVENPISVIEFEKPVVVEKNQNISTAIFRQTKSLSSRKAQTFRYAVLPRSRTEKSLRLTDRLSAIIITCPMRKRQSGLLFPTSPKFSFTI